ncbi:hypothetical protein K435DRAFT_600266, partial [Dendrothele bispora CBS 962.96]
GYFSILFIIALYVLLVKQKKHQTLNKPMIVVSIVMFLLATVHAGVDLRRVLDAFLHTDNPTGYLSKVNTVAYSVKSTAYCIQTLVGDGFVLYRLYLVWNGDKRVVIPLLICFIASIGVGIGALQGFARASPQAPVFITELHQIVSFFSLTLVTNFCCTTLIAARIWWSHRRMAGNNMAVYGRSVMPAAVIIIESGAIYSVCLIILLILYLSGSFAQYIALDAVSLSWEGIVFSLIIVRVGLGLSS